MLLRYSLNLEAEAAAIEGAVKKTLAQGWRTGDIAVPGETVIGCIEMGNKVIENLA